MYTYLYQDDILVGTPTPELHFEVIEFVLKQLSYYNLKVNLGKCQFLMSSIPYLGFVINSEGITPDLSRVEQILNFPTPESTSQIPSFWACLPSIVVILTSFPRLHSHYTRY